MGWKHTDTSMYPLHTRIYSRYALWVSYFMKELVIMHSISTRLLSPCRIPSIISYTSRRSQRSSSKFCTTTCSWLRKRSAPPSPSTCLRSAAGSARRKANFLPSDRGKVEWLNTESINNDNNSLRVCWCQLFSYAEIRLHVIFVFHGGQLVRLGNHSTIEDLRT